MGPATSALSYILATRYPILSHVPRGHIASYLRRFWKQDLGSGLLAVAEVALLLDASVHRFRR